MTNPNSPQYGAPTPPPAGMPPTGVPPKGVPPQYGVPFQPPKKKAKKWPWIVGAIVVLFIIIAAVSGGGGDDKNSTETAGAPGATTAAKETATQEREDAPAGMNTPVRDGKFEFVVTDVQSGLESVGDNPYLTEQAQGQFVIVTMTVENTSDAQGILTVGSEAVRRPGPQLRAEPDGPDRPRRFRYRCVGQHQSRQQGDRQGRLRHAEGCCSGEHRVARLGILRWREGLPEVVDDVPRNAPECGAFRGTRFVGGRGYVVDVRFPAGWGLWWRMGRYRCWGATLSTALRWGSCRMVN